MTDAEVAAKMLLEGVLERMLRHVEWEIKMQTLDESKPVEIELNYLEEQVFKDYGGAWIRNDTFKKVLIDYLRQHYNEDKSWKLHAIIEDRPYMWTYQQSIRSIIISRL